MATAKGLSDEIKFNFQYFCEHLEDHGGEHPGTPCEPLEDHGGEPLLFETFFEPLEDHGDELFTF